MTKITAQKSVATDAFDITIKQPGSETTLVVLSGELDLYRSPEIDRALVEATKPGGGRRTADHAPRRLIFDLRAVTFLDSTMLHRLLAAQRRQRARGGELLVLVGPQTPTIAFEVTGCDRRLSIRRVGDVHDRNGQAASPAAAKDATRSPRTDGTRRRG